MIGFLKRKEKVPTIYVRAGTVIHHQGAAKRSMIVMVAPADLELDHAD